ncbi:hypothetical protein [Dysgonomonas macrotermitis]|uniref:Helix-turn-helix domain-containing protein n=1 Tax=Dysgonomonas macrotermitis TaxID=1346286 RepID=A0A1M5J0X0_9BACT|nr:hypothetical protein [Dysgonomonas macrotermitis]SHG33870.1 hypothetical protein SAMN05444362_12172 [Dysgonomonas macrotermitis]
MNGTVIYHVLSDESLDKKLKELLLTKEESLIERFHGVIVPSSWVCKIHNVSEATVTRYVKRGLLPVIERTSSRSNLQFRLSDILKTDFDKLRKLI